MIKKTIIITLLFTLTVNMLFSQNYQEGLSKLVQLKLTDKEINTHILCFTDKGMVTWDVTLPFDPAKVSSYCSYYTYSEVEYIETPGKTRAFPAIAGAGLASLLLITSVSSSENEEDKSYSIMASVLLGGVVLAAGVALSFYSQFIPQRTTVEDSSVIDKLPTDYYTFTGELPSELSEFISQHEK